MLRSWIGILLAVGAGAAVAAVDRPFWKAKPKVYERLLNREVIMSVTARDEAPKIPRYHLEVQGGGIADAPCDFVFQHGQNYEKLAGNTGYIERAKYDPASHILTVKVSAYGFTQEMQARMTASEAKQPRTIKYAMISGSLQGFQGQMAFEDLDKGRCETGLSGGMGYQKFPIPRIFLEFGMEVVFQRMAQRLRTHVEEEYKAERGK